MKKVIIKIVGSQADDAAQEPEELARRDLNCIDSTPEEDPELAARMDAYLDEFEKNGIDNLSLDG